MECSAEFLAVVSNWLPGGSPGWVVVVEGERRWEEGDLIGGSR